MFFLCSSSHGEYQTGPRGWQPTYRRFRQSVEDWGKATFKPFDVGSGENPRRLVDLIVIQPNACKSVLDGRGRLTFFVVVSIGPIFLSQMCLSFRIINSVVINFDTYEPCY
jgi:hypothetical protein